MAAIVNTGRSKIALQAGSGLPLVVTKFVFANVPGLDVAAPVNLFQGLPSPAHVVYEQEIGRQGYVAPNKVVYSVILGPNVGDFYFNWIGLVDQDNTLIAVSYTPLQYKYKTVGLAVGNTLTRNFLMQYDNAASITNINVIAMAWQIDFIARINDSDEKRRQSDADFYGPAFFSGDSFKIVASGQTVRVKQGYGYVAGLRVNQAADAIIATGVLPRDIYVEAYLEGDASGTNVVSEIKTSPVDAPLVDYVDTLGNTHFLVKIATVSQAYAVTDLRNFTPRNNAPFLSYLLQLINLKAHLNSPALTGVPTAPTPAPGNNSTQIATAEFVNAVKVALDAALALRAPIASPAFTGTPTAPTAAAGTNTTQVASTAFVNAVKVALDSAVALRATIASPAFTGTPTAPTAAAGTNNTQIANTAFVQAAVAALVDSSPAALDTLKEFAAALGNDPNFATTITNLLATKAPLNSPALTGVPTAPTPAPGNNSTQIATAEFVNAVKVALDAAVALRAPLASPALTGTPTAPTAAAGTNTTQLATTEFVSAVKVALDAALALRAPIASPAFTGTPTAPTAAAGTNTTQVANTAFVNAVKVVLDSAVALRATIASPAFTGIPTAPTAAAGTNNTQIANTAFVQAAVAALVDSSPAALDTLKEFAAALGNDPNFATTITNLLATKAPLNSPALTGAPTAPTPATGNNSTQVATTAFVQNLVSTSSLKWSGSSTSVNISGFGPGMYLVKGSGSPYFGLVQYLPGENTQGFINTTSLLDGSTPYLRHEQIEIATNGALYVKWYRAGNFNYFNVEQIKKIGG